MGWSDEHIAQLAAGVKEYGDLCGLIVAACWPMPEEVAGWYRGLRKAIVEEVGMEAVGAHVYPDSALHITVGTLRSFHQGGDLPAAAAREEVERVWSKVLQDARADPRWPRAPFPLRVVAPGAALQPNGIGVIRYDDPDGGVAAIRACLADAIGRAGGKAAIGGGDRAAGRAPAGSRPVAGTGAAPPPPHLPDIVHTTFLRWAAEPFEGDGAAEEEAALRARFEAAVAAYWEKMPAPEAVVADVAGLFEVSPYMHMRSILGEAAAERECVFWRSGAP
eukprot:TRINITY_DN28530_c0_g1_i1.p1 TRINITY_DN28530_c0_g1~~TRINITY_DN28530_c0_g1_i1.p1  ORF type:complete len:277 (+),score=88.27 TRINITY_DN28530_c0_g1_i1:66-896(+)